MRAYNSLRSGRTAALLVVVGLVIVVGVAAVAAAGPDEPGATPVPTPLATSSPNPTPATPAPQPTPLRVVLRTATVAKVTVDIQDRSGRLVDAVSGTPGDGVSVPVGTVVVRNVDPRTLSLTWMDYPIDNALTLFVEPATGGLRFVLVQPEPTGDTDSIGFDRVLILTFDEPVSAADVEAVMKARLPL